ncbi:MAG: GIY-YIG nuclease family protein [Polyangiaceae bacterium]
MLLAELSVLVADCQATGATPAHGSLLELAWAVARPGAPVEVRSHTIALPAGQHVPPIVSRVTGITDADMTGAIGDAEAWAGLRAEAAALARALALGDGLVPTVIHFAHFEQRFLRDVHQRAGEGAFPLEIVCAHDIARRLMPELPRRNLRALAGYYGHGLHLFRRSRGHAEATAFVWRHLVGDLATRGITTWAELATWLEDRSPVSRQRRAFPLPRARRLELPDAPGVYRFLRSNGDILYVGKAASLKKRVSSHYTQATSVARANDRSLEMLTQAREVRVTPTASALEAALLETDEIKLHDPPYNVQLREHGRAAWFSSIELDDAAPSPDDHFRWGPLPSRRAVLPLGAVRDLHAGAQATPELRARALGIANPRWAPEPEMFAAGWAAFVEQQLAPARSRSAWGTVRKASRTLLRQMSDVGLEEGEPDDSGERPWTVDRVRRHLERAVAASALLLRRARWLCLLADGAVCFREAGADKRRLLVHAAGQSVLSRDVEEGEAIRAPEEPRRWRERQCCFDAARYDRVRVLATELKRVVAEGGEVAVLLDPRRTLEGERLGKLLRWV